MHRITREGLDAAVVQSRLARAPGVIDRRDIVDRDVLCYVLDPVSGQHVPSNLKLDDDVLIDGTVDPVTNEVSGGFAMRVVGPAEGREWFCACGFMIPEDTMPTTGVFHISQITDRAPVDPNETPMPIGPAQTAQEPTPPSLEEPPTEGEPPPPEEPPA